MDMSGSQIICPKCRSRLNKPPQLDVLGAIKQSGGSFIAFGDPDKTLTCPACGFQIRVGDIIDGKFDPPKSGWPGVFGIVVLLVFAGWLIVKCSK